MFIKTRIFSNITKCFLSVMYSYFYVWNICIAGIFFCSFQTANEAMQNKNNTVSLHIYANVSQRDWKTCSEIGTGMEWRMAVMNTTRRERDEYN